MSQPIDRMSNSHSTHSSNHSGGAEVDENIVEIWLRRDPIRWGAGILGGLFAGLVMMGVAVLLAGVWGIDPLLPVKVPAIPFMGAMATEYTSMPGLILGLSVHELMCAFLGFVYAHFTGGNSKRLLFGIGITWGIFGWIFISCLFTPSFREVAVADLPKGLSFFAWIAYGLSLMSVGFFDRLLRGTKRS